MAVKASKKLSRLADIFRFFVCKIKKSNCDPLLSYGVRFPAFVWELGGKGSVGKGRGREGRGKGKGKGDRLTPCLQIKNPSIWRNYKN